LFGWVYLFGLSPGAGESEGGVEEVRGFWGAMKSLFFCLIKRTKNQGCGIDFKAQFSDLQKFSLRALYFIRS
jgi:hypothetical protein